MSLCPACLSPPTESTIEAREMMMGLRTTFVYRECSACGSLWLQDTPPDLERYYGDGYYSMEGDGISKRSPALDAASSALMGLPSRVKYRAAAMGLLRPEWLNWLPEGLSKDAVIADVGGGEGVLVRRLAHCGFRNVWVFDPFVSRSYDDGAMRIRKATIDAAETDFDFIMFNHSLEHVPDPLETLTAAKGRLRPGGAILVRLPVAEHAWRVYGSNWVALDPPRHLFVPTVRGFGELADRAGLTIVREFFDSTSLQFWGSERYLHDYPLHERLPAADAESERRNMKRWEREARKLNRTQQGDNAGFIMRRT